MPFLQTVVGSGRLNEDPPVVISDDDVLKEVARELASKALTEITFIMSRRKHLLQSQSSPSESQSVFNFSSKVVRKVNPENRIQIQYKEK